MKRSILVYVFYPALFIAISTFASGHKLFQSHSTAWEVTFFLVLFALVWIPYMFLPHFKGRHAGDKGKIS